MAAGNPISFRLSPEAIELLQWFEDNLGLKRSAAVEFALRETKARQAGKPKARPKKSKKIA